MRYSLKTHLQIYINAKQNLRLSYIYMYFFCIDSRIYHGTCMIAVRYTLNELCHTCEWFMAQASNVVAWVAPHCNSLQHTATHCNTLQRSATHCLTLKQTITKKIHGICRRCRKAHTKWPATHRNTLQHTASHCKTLQNTATHCLTLQHTQTNNAYAEGVKKLKQSNTAISCNTLQQNATRCNTLQHTATH